MKNSEFNPKIKNYINSLDFSDFPKELGYVSEKTIYEYQKEKYLDSCEYYGVAFNSKRFSEKGYKEYREELDRQFRSKIASNQMNNLLRIGERFDIPFNLSNKNEFVSKMKLLQNFFEYIGLTIYNRTDSLNPYLKNVLHITSSVNKAYVPSDKESSYTHLEVDFFGPKEMSLHPEDFEYIINMIDDFHQKDALIRKYTTLNEAFEDYIKGKL